jgi:hypothetical protein
MGDNSTIKAKNFKWHQIQTILTAKSLSLSKHTKGLMTQTPIIVNLFCIYLFNILNTRLDFAENVNNQENLLYDENLDDIDELWHQKSVKGINKKLNLLLRF